MTTVFRMESKCPKCGKIYGYLRVASMFVISWNKDDLRSLLNYKKICDCGETFDMSKNETGVELPPTQEEIDGWTALLGGYNMGADKANDIVSGLL